MMKRWAAAAVALAGACAPAPGAVQTVVPSPMEAPGFEPPPSAWVAAFEHLFDISGADRTDPPVAYCVQVGSAVHAAEVMAELRSRAPRHAPQACVQADGYQTTPDGRGAWRFRVSSIYISGAWRPGRWVVDMGFMAGPLHGTGWRCLLNQSDGEWTLSECERTFTS